MWSDFNEANTEAMLKSELISWPVTLAILVLAFGSLVAAGLPLMLTILGLVASAGVLYLGTLISPISIWAMNFALMFALALGIDYALFIVMRFRGALFGQAPRRPARRSATTMDTAGKAVLFSGLTVLVSLSAVMLVPSPAFRSMALGIMISVLFVLAATLTLLPAVLAKLGPRVDRLGAALGPQRRAPLAALRALGRAALAPAAALRRPRAGRAARAGAAGARPATPGCPRSRSCPRATARGSGYEQVSAAFGPGAPGTLQVVAPQRGAAGRGGAAAATRASPRSLPAAARRAAALALIEAIPAADPSSTGARRRRSTACAPTLPAGALVGGAAAENHDLEQALAAKTPLVIGVVLGARLPAAAGRLPGAADRRDRGRSPTCSPPARPSASPS